MAELIRAKHAELGDAVVEIPNTDHYLDNGWSRVADDAPLDADNRGLFDPSEHNAHDVVAYLASLDDPAEHVRVKSLESAGQARKTITEWSA